MLLGALAIVRHKGKLLTEAVRLLPDLLRLVSRLAGDCTLPRRTRWLLWILIGYPDLSIDPVSDFIPVFGYADDAIAIALVLPTVIRESGTAALDRHSRRTRQRTPAGRAAHRDSPGVGARQGVRTWGCLKRQTIPWGRDTG
ncbi:YkvA family protein [Streptomyces collinus]|uniref:YkvA family protein n=1 Tax=Streptomyces collinus TaxID=42684 RepID=UPI00363CCC06